jgi:UDP-N-acetylmuramyl pentapeptide phosphotransferase/UDP-N-acetylglucosamine-1-phosphate transferase
MNNLGLLLIFLIIFFFFKKINYLNENTNYSTHKNFGKSNKSPIVLGGIFLSIITVIFFSNDLIILKISLLLIYLLGFLSDKNILPNPKIRILLQIFILLFLIIFSQLKIINLENYYLNIMLENELFNIFFTVFCLAILINGSNFLDGLNGLLSGYYLLIILSIIYVGNNYNNINLIFENELKILFFSLLIFFIFNIFGKVYLGDGGSYLIATLIGFYLIQFSLSNSQVSPYYVAALLWYPAFENLFSLTRRLVKKNKISSPDNEHLHQLIFLFIKSKKILKDKFLNSFTSLVILAINIPIFILANLMIDHSFILMIIILSFMFLYTLIYSLISKNLNIDK